MVCMIESVTCFQHGAWCAQEKRHGRMGRFPLFNTSSESNEGEMTKWSQKLK